MLVKYSGRFAGNPFVPEAGTIGKLIEWCLYDSFAKVKWPKGAIKKGRKSYVFKRDLEFI